MIGVMLLEYSTYNTKGSDFMECANQYSKGDYLNCMKTNERCIFSKYCHKSKKWVFNERMNSANCSFNKMDKKKNEVKNIELPKGAYLIEQKRVVKNKVMIVAQGINKVFWFNYQDVKDYFNQDYIYVKEENNNFIASFNNEF